MVRKNRNHFCFKWRDSNTSLHLTGVGREWKSQGEKARELKQKEKEVQRLVSVGRTTSSSDWGNEREEELLSKLKSRTLGVYLATARTTERMVSLTSAGTTKEGQL